ncbi:MAG TPA: alpha/beta fold hydrolase [Amycolatopsis sp.]|uniref:Alpha/beta fold hydrolase n=1 Tax=Amycolatopsis nalaikhensis TaxID=715472 RepID=A0ABY8XW60_9PSEU|nr:alpha/beta fold hydrolase [Amycolatopsis sp. 2-2]WIV59837.1 alpha/beta fold hydrolase [Amycolatopsis sp. 2-2]
MRIFPRRALAAAVATVSVLALSALGPPSAAAASFYDPPSPLPAGSDGDVIRHEASTFYIDPVQLIKADASVQRIMYRSRDTHGSPIAVTGTVLTPRSAWHGSGVRPIVSYAVGTQGEGDDCAPSKALAAGFEYEGPFIAGLLARGYGVVVTDYEGLGTPGDHTYVNREAEAHAVLDAIRAAQRLPEAGLPDDGPVAIAGYSQGGGASAAAAELQPSYAPELKLKGAYAGAVPADLAAVAKNLDGHYAVGFLGFALVSMNYAYPELNIPALLNARGKQLFEQVRTECTVEAVAAHAFTQSSTLTSDGRSLTAYLGEEPYASRVAEQKIGTLKPSVPVLIVHSALDDIVPYEQDRTLGRTWCGKGVKVQFSTSLVPTHVLGAVRAYPEAFAWLEGRFAGLPPISNCGLF